MIKNNKSLLIAAVLLAALVFRILLRERSSFFCDAPTSVAAIESGRMIIQFPGYAPYHHLIGLLAKRMGSPSIAMTWFSLLCGYGAVLYTTYLARAKAGNQAALLTAVVMGFSIVPVYFSSVGTSYATDMLAASGMLAHGYGDLISSRRNHYAGVLFWFCFGFLMRPLSFAFTGLGLVYLLFVKGSTTTALLTVISITATTLFYLAISIPHYGSLISILTSTSKIQGELQSFNLISLLTNIARVVIYPLWGLHLFLIFVLAVWWREGIPRRQPFFRYLLLLSIPYFLILIRYIPHAGYYALLMPSIVMLPWCNDRPLINIRAVVTLLFGVILAAQIVFVRPTSVTGAISLISNAYMFQYSATGIKNGTFDTLSSLAYKSGVMKDRIPPRRIDDTRRAVERE